MLLHYGRSNRAIPVLKIMLKHYEKRIFLCYVSGLDLRRIERQVMPFLTRALND
jgi:hypothetical protein